jgi:hypothetical protein
MEIRPDVVVEARGERDRKPLSSEGKTVGESQEAVNIKGDLGR